MHVDAYFDVPKSARAVIFDLDGTLFNYEGSVSRALISWLPSLGIEPRSELLKLWHELATVHYPDAHSGTISWRDRRRRLGAFLTILRVPYAESQLREIFEGYLQIYESSYQAFPDAASALGRVREAGLTVGILTNGPTVRQLEKLHVTGLLKFCDLVCTSQELGVAKPDPMAYRMASARLGLELEQLLMVGDNYALDVAAPRHLGIAAVHLDRSCADTTGCSHRIATLDALRLPGRDLAVVPALPRPPRLGNQPGSGRTQGNARSLNSAANVKPRTEPLQRIWSPILPL